MKITEIQIGTKLELDILDTLEINTKAKYVSELEWAEDENYAYIAAPICEGMVQPLHPGIHMNVYFIYKVDEYNLDLYKFKANIIDRDVKDNFPLLKIKITEDIARVQRRQFFRFKCEVPVKYRIISDTDSETEIASDHGYIETKTVDLSGGGFCFICDERIEIDSELEGKMHLNNERKLNFKGSVVRCIRFRQDAQVKYEIGVLYTKIEHRDRDAVIGYIFNEQRKLRKKGLI